MEVIERQVSAVGDGVKLVLAAPDGVVVESFLFRKAKDRVRAQRNPGDSADENHLCISSQAGCNQKCTFCRTGQQPVVRNLTAAEILSQVDASLAAAEVDSARVTFAGMGEPLANYRQVVTAARDLATEPAWTSRIGSVSLSSIGIVPNLARLAAERLPLRLYLSLHAADDAVRTRLIPPNAYYSLEKVIAAGDDYATVTGSKVTASYLLLKDVNDSKEDAQRLAAALDPARWNVQVLMWNAVAGMDFVRVSDESAEDFAAVFRDRGFHAYVMGSRGQDVNGACGQLAGRGRPGQKVVAR